MKTYPIYQVDAFTNKLFSGNPAAVCPLKYWLPDTIMQKIAAENNLAETAFYVNMGNTIHIRWFTPHVEVDLCGHATLASAYVLFFEENYKGKSIIFTTEKSGTLTVTKKDKLLTLNFPSDKLKNIEPYNELLIGFDIKPNEILKGNTDYLLVYENEEQISKLNPDFQLLNKVDCRGIIVTAPGKTVDFVSRFFAPQVGINEDPVTGSAHTTLIPFWSKRLKKNQLKAIQLSERKGYLTCNFLNDRVEISGEARLFLKGEIFIEQIITKI